VPLEWLAPLAMVVLGAVFQILMHGFQWGRGVYAVIDVAKIDVARRG
jgi:hypothetical protein